MARTSPMILLLLNLAVCSAVHAPAHKPGIFGGGETADGKTSETVSRWTPPIKANGEVDLDNLEITTSDLVREPAPTQKPVPGKDVWDEDFARHIPKRDKKMEQLMFPDPKVMPNITQFRMVHKALATTKELWLAACHASERIVGCDPIHDMLHRITADLEKAIESEKPSKMAFFWRFQEFVKRLVRVTDEMDFEELWMILQKRNWREITPASLGAMSDQPMLRYGLEPEDVDYMFKIGDHDSSGGLSHDEFRNYLYALSECLEKPLTPVHYAQNFDRIEFESWLGIFNDSPKMPKKVFHLWGKR